VSTSNDDPTREDARAPSTEPTGSVTAEHPGSSPRSSPLGSVPPDGPYSTRGETSLVPVVVAQGTEDLFHRLGRQTREAITYLGGISKLSWSTVRVLPLRPFGFTEFVQQCESIGVKSMPIAVLILFFVGLVFALQFGLTLQTMGAVPYLGKITSLSIVRELGPVFTALVVGSRVGAGMAAELGSMRVTEQVDAIRALGADPVKKLVVPRVLATTMMLPLVSLFADIIGIIGGMIISYMQFDLSIVAFYKSSVSTVHVTDFISGYMKPFFFGFGIAIIGCYEGLTCGQGTEGVGRATTRTVVNVAIMVVLVDFFLTKLFTMLPRI
jgi:phospholipid/cholesterol/gamma-HCH transport system permease protein